MIPVAQQPEPATFDALVRLPGLNALAERTGQPSTLPDRHQPFAKRADRLEDLKSEDIPPIWTDCLPDLHIAYQGVCAYLCLYIPKAVATPTVDHFEAKRGTIALASVAPTLIYEWLNYRLACHLMNTRKGNHADVVDPFEIEDGWFELEFTYLEMSPNKTLAADVQARLWATIVRLGLNDAECTSARSDLYDEYRQREVTFRLLSRRSPFVAREMVRQGMVRDEDLPSNV